MADTNAAPIFTAEDESISGFSNDNGESSGEDTQPNGPATAGKKRKREKYQKTSCVNLCRSFFSLLIPDMRKD